MLELSQIDEVVTVGGEETLALTGELARVEGIPGGISPGAALPARPRWRGGTRWPAS